MKVFICGPVNKSNFEKTRRSFEEAEQELLNAGFSVVNPLKDINNPNKYMHDEVMKKDIGELISCDYITVLDGYITSEDCLLEISIANKCGIKQIAIR